MLNQGVLVHVLHWPTVWLLLGLNPTETILGKRVGRKMERDGAEFIHSRSVPLTENSQASCDSPGKTCLYCIITPKKWIVDGF